LRSEKVLKTAAAQSGFSLTHKSLMVDVRHAFIPPALNSHDEQLGVEAQRKHKITSHNFYDPIKLLFFDL
jgi:hypothetical protein